MTTTPPISGSTPAEEPNRPYIRLKEAPYAPIRWLGDESFWKGIAVNVYSAAIVAVFTVTLVSVAQMIKAHQYDHIFLPISAGVGAIIAPPLFTLFSYGIQQRNHLPKKDRWTTVVVFSINILLSLAAVSVVIVLGIQNILSS